MRNVCAYDYFNLWRNLYIIYLVILNWSMRISRWEWGEPKLPLADLINPLWWFTVNILDVKVHRPTFFLSTPRLNSMEFSVLLLMNIPIGFTPPFCHLRGLKNGIEYEGERKNLASPNLVYAAKLSSCKIEFLQKYDPIHIHVVVRIEWDFFISDLREGIIDFVLLMIILLIH